MQNKKANCFKTKKTNPFANLQRGLKIRFLFGSSGGTRKKRSDGTAIATMKLSIASPATKNGVSGEV